MVEQDFCSPTASLVLPSVRQCGELVFAVFLISPQIVMLSSVAIVRVIFCDAIHMTTYNYRVAECMYLAGTPFFLIAPVSLLFPSGTSDDLPLDLPNHRGFVT
jgi:hypothetical protein